VQGSLASLASPPPARAACTPSHPLRFQLLAKVRVARHFGSLAGRRHLVAQRLLAFNVLYQSSPAQGGPRCSRRPWRVLLWP
jgi:hypothetical protein